MDPCEDHAVSHARALLVKADSLLSQSQRGGPSTHLMPEPVAKSSTVGKSAGGERASRLNPRPMTWSNEGGEDGLKVLTRARAGRSSHFACNIVLTFQHSNNIISYYVFAQLSKHQAVLRVDAS